jgi:hypothetical protein
MGREFLRPHRIYLSLRNVSFNLFSRHDDVQSSRPGGSIVQRPLNAVMASRTRTTIYATGPLTGPRARPGVLSRTCTGDTWAGAARAPFSAPFSAPTPKPTWRFAVATAFAAMSGRGCTRPAGPGASSLVDATCAARALKSPTACYYSISRGGLLQDSAVIAARGSSVRDRLGSSPVRLPLRPWHDYCTYS